MSQTELSCGFAEIVLWSFLPLTLRVSVYGTKRCYAVNVNPDWGLYSVEQDDDVCISDNKDTDGGSWGCD